MLYPKTRWSIRQSDEQIVELIANQLELSPLIAKLLVNRGLDTVEKVKEFLFIDQATFHDPYLIRDMEKSVHRIHEAIYNEEPILIYGDYDADGVTSTSVLMLILKKLGANVSYYIPNRFTEGYGPNEEAFRKAHVDGIQLIITVDTGISAIHEAKIAKELGMDLIITDHHEVGDTLPEAFAIIHPKLPNSIYPFADLAGVGVAFKLAHALNEDVPDELLDLVAIGTIADLVPLHGENRLIVKKGLQKLTMTLRPGLLALCKVAGTSISDVDEEDVGFMIGPRLNAAGRITDASSAVELLLANDQVEALSLAQEIDSLNKERQKIVSTITNEAIEMVEKQWTNDNKVIVIGKEGWNAGVIGIVASRLVEKYYRPTIVLSYDEETGLAKGSARSIPGFDLFAQLSKLANLLPHFGGHSMAAGMTLPIENVEELRIKLDEAIQNELSDEDFIPLTELDIVMTVDEVDIDFIHQLEQLGPYGMDNPKPIVMIENAYVSSIRKIGANQNHLKMVLESTDKVLDGVGFNLGHLTEEMTVGASINVLGELSINEWNHMKKPQIFLQDMEIKSWQLFDMRGNKQFEHWIPTLVNEDTIFIQFQQKHHDLLAFYKDPVNHLMIDQEEKAVQCKIDHKNIVLLDLPPNIHILERLVLDKCPHRIYVHFHQEQNHYFSILPTRDHFKWYYAFLFKRKSFDLKRHGKQLADHRGWTTETVEFMSQVFFELDFVTINNGIVEILPTRSKKDLTDSKTYQNKQNQIVVEKELLYSSFQQLKQWFDERVKDMTGTKEEKIWI